MIETPRLRLRHPSLADVPTLHAFMGDPTAMQHTHVHETQRDLRRHLAAHRWHGRKIGCAPWTIIEKSSNHIIGFGGLYDDLFDPGNWGIEVGYFFAPTAWGKGYASELVSACIKDARDRMHIPELRAFAHPANVASRRVLTKAGFQETRYVEEMDRFFYILAL